MHLIDDTSTHRVVQLFGITAFLITLISRDLPSANAANTTIIDRGENFAVFRNRAALTDSTGEVTFHSNEFTLLENALGYLEGGEWKFSEDLIEPFAGGAVARRGPHKAIFSHDLSAPAVFDIEASDGLRLRGGGPFHSPD